MLSIRLTVVTMYALLVARMMGIRDAVRDANWPRDRGSRPMNCGLRKKRRIDCDE
jgi:hypothetical protein